MLPCSTAPAGARPFLFTLQVLVGLVKNQLSHSSAPLFTLPVEEMPRIGRLVSCLLTVALSSELSRPLIRVLETMLVTTMLPMDVSSYVNSHGS